MKAKNVLLLSICWLAAACTKEEVHQAQHLDKQTIIEWTADVEREGLLHITPPSRDQRFDPNINRATFNEFAKLQQDFETMSLLQADDAAVAFLQTQNMDQNAWYYKQHLAQQLVRRWLAEPPTPERNNRIQYHYKLLTENNYGDPYLRAKALLAIQDALPETQVAKDAASIQKLANEVLKKSPPNKQDILPREIVTAQEQDQFSQAMYEAEQRFRRESSEAIALLSELKQ